MSKNTNDSLPRGIFGESHTSYHNSGQVNQDLISINSGISHHHDKLGKDVRIIEIDGQRLTRDSDGVLRTSDGEVFRGDSTYDD